MEIRARVLEFDSIPWLQVGADDAIIATLVRTAVVVAFVLLADSNTES